MNIVPLSQTILREQGMRVLQMVTSAVFEGARMSGNERSRGLYARVQIPPEEFFGGV